MLLEEIYTELKEQELVGSQVEFSEKWLNKSARYMSMIKATGRQPSLDTLVRLLANLKLHYDIYNDSRLEFIHKRAEQIKPSLQRVNAELLQEANPF